MSVPVRSPYKKMSMTSGKGKSSGWTAFDLKQRQKQGLAPETEDDPFPPMSNSVPALLPSSNMTRSNDLSARSFSSLLNRSGKYPTLKQNKDSTKPINMGKPIVNDGDKVAEGNNNNLALRKLKELHSWADNSLIEDILLAANNNIHKALTLLKGMMPMNGTEDVKETENNEIGSSHVDLPGISNYETGFASGKTAELIDQSSKADEREDVIKKLADLYENKLFDQASNMKLILEQLASIPLEPEWEEDDVYLSHRKEAIRMMRSASQHSRAANNAFLRGDHFAAQQHSQNAREEWLTAQRLNAKAAREILSIRNSENDMWKLDLHGLHASEAVQVLHEHLRKIESQVPSRRSVSPDRKVNNGVGRSSSAEKYSSMDNLAKQQTSSRQRPTSLQVITGVGNHSHGQASLPTAVRNFLIENGYRFDEARPGLITVRPKFRRG